jgi:hypothetical protein
MNRRDSLQCQQQHSIYSSKNAQARLRRRVVITHGIDSNSRVPNCNSNRYGALVTKGRPSFVVSAGGENNTSGDEESSQQGEVKVRLVIAAAGHFYLS